MAVLGYAARNATRTDQWTAVKGRAMRRTSFAVLLALLAAAFAGGFAAAPAAAASTCFGHTATVARSGISYHLTAGDDVVVGTNKTDAVDDLGGVGGTDYICTGSGADDVSISIAGPTSIDTGSGNDTITVSGQGANDLTVDAGSGNDYLDISGTTGRGFFEGGEVRLNGGSGNDALFVFAAELNDASDASIEITAGSGEDSVFGNIAFHRGFVDCGSNADTYTFGIISNHDIRRCEHYVIA